VANGSVAASAARAVSRLNKRSRMAAVVTMSVSTWWLSHPKTKQASDVPTGEAGKFFAGEKAEGARRRDRQTTSIRPLREVDP